MKTTLPNYVNEFGVPFKLNTTQGYYTTRYSDHQQNGKGSYWS